MHRAILGGDRAVRAKQKEPTTEYEKCHSERGQVVEAKMAHLQVLRDKNLDFLDIYQNLAYKRSRVSIQFARIAWNTANFSHSVAIFKAFRGQPQNLSVKRGFDPQAGNIAAYMACRRLQLGCWRAIDAHSARFYGKDVLRPLHFCASFYFLLGGTLASHAQSSLPASRRRNKLQINCKTIGTN